MSEMDEGSCHSSRHRTEHVSLLFGILAQPLPVFRVVPVPQIIGCSSSKGRRLVVVIVDHGLVADEALHFPDNSFPRNTRYAAV